MKRLIISSLLVFGFTTTNHAQLTCASNATSTADSNVGNVVLNGDSQNINNSTAGVCATYSNFTASTNADLTIGNSYNVAVTQGTCGGNYNRYVNVWIDWDQSGTINNANEEMIYVPTGTTGGSPASNTANLVSNFTITVPGGAALGATTMRVIVKESGAATDPCAVYTWGETEDYTVTVLSAGPMTYTSSTTTQANTSNISKCSNDQVIVGVEVVTTGSTAPLRLKDLRLRTDGSTNILNDVTNIDVYYTGSSNTYNTTSLFGSATPLAPGINFLVSGDQLLNSGTNYFWVAYDIAPGATVGNNLDARCTRLVIADNGNTVNTNYTPTVLNPAGNRTLDVCIPGPGGLSTNLAGWFDASNGTVGTAPVTTWNNLGYNANIPSLSSTGNPSLQTGLKEYNFNNAVDLDGGYAGTFHHEVSNSNDVITGNGIAMYCVFIGSGVPDLVFEFHGSINSTDASRSANNWQTYGFRHNGIGSMFNTSPSTSHGYPYNFPGTANNNINFVGMKGTTNGTGVNSNNGVYSNYNVVGNFNAPSCEMELSIGYWPGYGTGRPIAEAIIFDQDLTTTEMVQLESYLAIKYGLTTGTNGTSQDYLGSNGTTVWSAASNAGFAFDIAGIMRDDASLMSQMKSHSTQGPSTTVFNDIVTVANGGTFASPSSMGTDHCAFIWGHNNGPTINTGSAVNYPTDNGETIEAIFLREWKSQETGTVGTVTLEFDMSAVLGVGSVAGANDLANLRLLVDEDGDFTNGATSIAPSSFNNGTDIAYFQHDFQPTDGNNMTQNNGFFFTLASTSFSVTPLPVEIIEYTVEANVFDQAVNTWIVKDELNIDYYAIDKSIDGLTWESVGTVTRTPDNQEQKTYSLLDENPYSGKSYYRLTEIDIDGALGAEVIRPFETTSSIALNVFPNPSNGNLNIIIEGDLSEINDLQIINPLGQIVRRKSNLESHIVEIQDLRSGLHSVMILSKNGEKFVKKFVVR